MLLELADVSKSYGSPEGGPVVEVLRDIGLEIGAGEAAAIIGIHPKTLQRYARQGLIRGVHVGKLWRFRGSTIEEWIDREELAS